MKTYLYPTIEIVSVETLSIICASGGEEITIGGENSPGGARAPKRTEPF